ncbi:MAG: ATP-binding protein, partial [Planctomycetota bacterium]
MEERNSGAGDVQTRETDADIPVGRETALAALEDPASRSRMLLCTSWRPDEEPAEWTGTFNELEQSAHATRIALKPLTLPDVRRLIVSMLGIAKDPGPLASKLHEESGGNPYVIEEVMKALVEEGVLAQRDGEWIVQTDTLAKLTLPAQVADVVGRRLGRLDDAGRNVLQVLAAVGRPVALELLARITEKPADDLLPLLEELVRRELLVRDRPEGTVRYRIPHKPLRDAAYETLPAADRPAIHARIAVTLEHGRDAVPDAEAEELAHHALLAADADRGPRYALQAGAHAATVYANVRAVEFYRGAAALLPDDDPRQDAIVEALAPLYTRTGEFDTAIAHYEQLLQRPGLTPVEIAARHGAISEIHRKKGDFAASLESAAAGKAVLPSDEPTREMVQLLIVEATVRVLQGDADGGRANANQALALADAVGDRESDAQLFVLLGHVGMVRGDVKEAIAQYRKALDAAEKLDDSAGIATAYHSLGHAYTRAGDFQSALGYLKRSQAIKERIGDIYRIADTLNNLGVLFIEKGDFPTALEYQRRCLAIRDRIGDQYGRAQAFSNLGILHDEMGNSLEAMRAFEQSLEIRRAIGDQDGIAVSLGNLGVTAHDRGDFARALTSLRQAVELRDQAGRIDEQIQVRVNLGHLYLTLGDLDAAAKPLEEAEAIAAGSPLRQHQADVQEALGVLDWLRGKWNSAERQLRGALENFKELSNTYGICEAEVAYAELAHECGQTD